MFEGITSVLGPHPPGPEPPVNPATPEPVRTVERAEKGGSSDGPKLDSDKYSPSRAVLELLKRSAEAFQSILETTRDLSAAVTMTGTASAATAQLGKSVDEYA